MSKSGLNFAMEKKKLFFQLFHVYFCFVFWGGTKENWLDR